jgi:hypothetical protein
VEPIQDIRSYIRYDIRYDVRYNIGYDITTSGMISVHDIVHDIGHDSCICNIWLLYSLPVLLRESKNRVVRSFAMAEEELQMPWYNHFETNHPNRASQRGNGRRVQDLQ